MGTPDLRDRFIVAAGNTYSPGQIGGTAGHNHAFSAGTHSHELVEGTALIDSSPDGQLDYHTSDTLITGGTAVAAHTTPFHALCYIMKLP
jgi:hypothetical protein